MSPPKKKQRYICSIHDEIREVAEDLETLLSDFLSKEPVEKLQRIQELAEEAREAGERMEARLLDYKHTIEGLGFKRKR